MIKTNYIYTAGLLLSLIWLAGITSCRKDIGNYKYSKIDSVAINGINDDYQVPMGTKTKITPVLSYESGTAVNENDFTYEWVYYADATISGNRTILSTAKTLDTILPLRVGTYNFYYTIKEKATGITWQKTFDLAIVGTFRKNGWFVLNDIAGESRLDYYEADPANWNTFPVIYRNMTSLIKDENTGEAFPLTGKPKSLSAFSTRDIINSTGFTYFLYVNTENSTLKINITAGFTWNKVKNLFTNETTFGEPASMDFIESGSGSAAAYGYKDGNLYLYNYGLAYYGTPLNRLAGSNRFNMAPYIAFPFNSSLHAMFYDTDNKRFVRVQSSSTAATPLGTTSGPIDLSNVGKDMVWMGYSNFLNSQVVAILKDNSSRYFLTRILFNTAASAPVITPVLLTDITSKLTGIAQADHFVMDHQFGYLFYTSGSKLYQYDIDNQILKLAKDYGTRKISMLKVNKITSRAVGSAGFIFELARLEAAGYAIIVGSYDEANPANSGTVDFLKAPELMGNLTTYFNAFTGLGKVVDVKYSE